MPTRDKPRPVLGLRFYRTEAGTQPVREWLKGLPQDVRREIGADIYAVQCRWPVGKPLVDGFGDGLYEVRSSFDRDEYRVLFYIEAGMIVLHGFQKKTRKTTASDIALARKRMKEDKAR